MPSKRLVLQIVLSVMLPTAAASGTYERFDTLYTPTYFVFARDFPGSGWTGSPYSTEVDLRKNQVGNYVKMVVQTLQSAPPGFPHQNISREKMQELLLSEENGIVSERTFLFTVKPSKSPRVTAPPVLASKPTTTPS